MFCDLVGSTPLAEQLDPEDLREVVRAYQEACAKVIIRFDGWIAQYLGDGLLVYFGYPLAHEDDPQRAVRAGLGIVEAITQLNAHLGQQRGLQLAVRLGIHTGLAVVGEVGASSRQEQLVVGETPNLAARLQGVAEPNTVVISVATYRILEGFFGCQALGTPALKGVSQPIEVYRVLYESAARSRLDVARSIGLTPLVGREQEVALLLERWEQVRDGVGQVVLLSGEAGIGKSRLVQVLQAHVATDPQAWLIPCQCSPYHQNSALYPVIDLLERVVLQFERDASPQQKLDKVEGFLVQYGLTLPKAVPLFAALLSIPLSTSYAPLSFSPEQQKQRTLYAILTILWRRAAQQQALGELVAAELLYQRGLPPQATYRFKHALIQEAAYQSLLRSTRQRSHQRIAQVLEAQFPETAETQPELVAHHYTEASLLGQAIPYWQRAGQRAIQRSAHVEAINHLAKSLDLLNTLPDTHERGRQELELQLALGPALMVTRGFAAPEVAATYARGRQLCEQLGQREQLFSVLFGLWRSSHARAQLPTARELGEQLLSMATCQGDPGLLVEAHGALGQTLCIQGELTLARGHLQQVVALDEPQRYTALAFRVGYDPGVYARAVEGWVLWLLGYPEQALRRSHDALTLAQEQAHPFTLALTLVTVAVLQQLRQEREATLAHVTASVILSTEHEFP
jgi:class 3 adenylate cyclase/tetratricopeptide (TPR) repeat protein